MTNFASILNFVAVVVMYTNIMLQLHHQSFKIFPLFVFKIKTLLKIRNELNNFVLVIVIKKIRPENLLFV